MSEVWLARRRSGAKEPLVMKWILPHLSTDPSFVQMLLNEARVAARLNHPNVARILDLGEADGTFYIAMEYVRGEDLGQLMRQAWRVGQWISHPVSMRIMSECCAALAYAHARTDESGRPLRVVHRDISPQNILLGLDGSVKLVDFGIAKAANLISTTEPGAIKGKFAYMSPEHAGGKPVDHKADIFSAGLVLYELLSGVRPLQRSTEAATHIAAVQCQIEPPSAVSETPPELDGVVMGALARAPEDRYATAAHMQRAIDQVAAKKGWFAGPDEIASLVEILFPERLDQDRKLGLLDAEEPEEATQVDTGKRKAASRSKLPALTPKPQRAVQPGGGDGEEGEGDEGDDFEQRALEYARASEQRPAVPEKDEEAAITEPQPVAGGGKRGSGSSKRKVGAGGDAPYRTGRDYPAAKARADSRDSRDEAQKPKPRPVTDRATRVASSRRLMVVDGVDGDRGKVMPFPGVQMVVGRGDQCELRLLDPSVSRRHLELVLGARGTYLRDLASDSGTRVNGKWVDERLLRHEDVIEVGVTRMQYMDEEEAARRTAEEAAIKAEEDKRRREEEARKAEEEEAARIIAEKAAKEQAEEEARRAAEEEARKEEEEEARERAEAEEAARKAAEEEAEKNRPIPAPPGFSTQSWTVLSPQQRLAVGIFVPLQIAVLVTMGLWAFRAPEPPPDPRKVNAENLYKQGRALLQGGRLEEAVPKLEAAEKLWPGTDATQLLPTAKKELEAQNGLKAARQLVRFQRFEEARQAVANVAPVSKLLQQDREAFITELDEAEAAAFQELRARESLLSGDMARARELINRLPDQARMPLLKRLMAKEDELITDTTTTQQKQERATYLASALKTVQQKFQGRDFDGALKECDHLVELTPGELLVHGRVDELKRLIPDFKVQFEEGVRRTTERNQAASYAPFLRARQLYREIGFTGPLGSSLDGYLLEASLISARDAMLRQDLATAGVRYRDAASIAPRDPRVVDGLEKVSRRAGKILADAYTQDRQRAPRLYLEKLELVREITPRETAENLRATEQIRLMEGGAAPAPSPGR
jgi:serine/threonine protein kinase/pSer/pThr/pTyr-binding forkhead associated (FHA) protein